jgi:uncharacterized protein involved in tolerance to divalent cations
MMASSEPITTNHHLFASSIGNHSLTHSLTSCIAIAPGVATSVVD